MPRKTILLVEDNEDNRIVFATILRHHDFEVLEAATGEDGLRLAMSEVPDLILMDISLPGMDGWEVTRRVKADPRTRHIPVIAVTAHTLLEDRERAAQIGFDSFLGKPCQPARVLAEVETFLGEDPTA